MIAPKFKISAKERIYLSDKYLSNGHWLIAYDNLKQNHTTPYKEVKKCVGYKPGFYMTGFSHGITDTNLPDFNAIIPKREGYELLEPMPIGVDFRSDFVSLNAYIYQTNSGKKIALNVDYVPLIGLGYAFMKDRLSPILILDSEDLNGNLLAVVMPYRSDKTQVSVREADDDKQSASG